MPAWLQLMFRILAQQGHLSSFKKNRDTNSSLHKHSKSLGIHRSSQTSLWNCDEPTSHPGTPKTVDNYWCEFFKHRLKYKVWEEFLELIRIRERASAAILGRTGICVLLRNSTFKCPLIPSTAGYRTGQYYFHSLAESFHSVFISVYRLK